MYEEILDKMQDLLKDEMKNLGGNFAELEQAVMATMMSFGKTLLQRLIDRGPNGYKGTSMVCKCGSSMKFIQHRSKDIHTLFGWVTVKRAYYHCSGCGRSLLPYDIAGGLGSEQLSTGLARACWQ